MNVNEITLYSGGHKGSEAKFGENAEKWGLKEINFSFEGHICERDKHLKVLNDDDLKKGDVSMEIVSQRMGRTYAKPGKIRKVIQSIFHMVNNGYYVFTIGWIQSDNTVKGGTGWGVELAKLFNRPISVFDQDKNKWFSWNNTEWVEDLPVIKSETFVGTGTRNLSAEGQIAVDDLFKRSFGELS